MLTVMVLGIDMSRIIVFKSVYRKSKLTYSVHLIAEFTTNTPRVPNQNI
jgi:hypothetical protein